jgi:transposase
LDEAYFGGRRKGNRGRGAAGKVSVFGILERDGLVHVNVVPDVSAATLLKLTVKKVRRGSVVYTDKFRSYDSLMFCGYRHLKVDHGKYFSSGKGLHQRSGGILELGQGAVYQAPWRL